MMIDAELLKKLVADSIPTHPEPHRTAAAIASELGEPEDRVRRAIASIKDEYPSLPLTAGPRGYRWSLDRVDVKRHLRKEERYLATRHERSTVSGVLEPLQASDGRVS